MFFKRKDRKITLDADVQVDACTTVFPLEFECPGQLYAELAVRRLNELEMERMRESERAAYNRGWSDAKAKRAKNP